MPLILIPKYTYSMLLTCKFIVLYCHVIGLKDAGDPIAIDGALTFEIQIL